MALLAVACGHDGPSDEHIAANERVLAAVPLPGGSERLSTLSDRFEVEGRFCHDWTTWVVRAPAATGDAELTAHFEEALGEQGGKAGVDYGGSEPVEVPRVVFEGAGVTLDLSDLAARGRFGLSTWQDC